jgi:hypothetical protein
MNTSTIARAERMAGRIGGRPPRKWIQSEIDRLDPVDDATRVYSLTMSQLAPESTVALHLYYTVGFIRMAGPPEGAKPVHHSGKGMVYRRGLQRSDDTMLQILGWIDHGVDSDAAGRSLKRVKGMHDTRGRVHAMPNDVFVHTACYFATSIDRFLALIGARGLTEPQREGIVNHWLQVAKALGIEKVPTTAAGMKWFLERFEASEQFTYSDEGHQVANALREHFARRWFRPRVRWLGRWLPLALSEPHVLEAVGLRAPPSLFTNALHHGVRLGIFVKRHLLADPPEALNLSAVFVGAHNSFDFEHRPLAPSH